MSTSKLIDYSGTNALAAHIADANNYDGNSQGVFAGLTDIEAQNYYYLYEDELASLGIYSADHWIAAINGFASRVQDGAIRSDTYFRKDGSIIDLSTTEGVFYYLKDVEFADSHQYMMACEGICIGALLLIGLITTLTIPACEDNGDNDVQVDDDTAPVDDDTTPADDDTLVDDDTTPTDDDTTPTDDDTTPVDDDTTPADDDTTPADDDTAPTDDDTTPADDDSIVDDDSGADDDTSVDDDTTPTDDDTACTANECGVCDGPVIGSVEHAPCATVNTNGCPEDGELFCNESGTAMNCATPNEIIMNECNICDGESVPDVGEECSFVDGACVVYGYKDCSEDGTGSVCVPSGDPGSIVCPPAGVNFGYGEISGTPVDIDMVGPSSLVYASDDTKTVGACPVTGSIDSVVCQTIATLPASVNGKDVTLKSHVDAGDDTSLVTFMGDNAIANEMSAGWFYVNRATGVVTSYDFDGISESGAGVTQTTYPRFTSGALISGDRLFVTAESLAYACTTAGSTDECSCGCAEESAVGAIYAFPRCADGAFKTRCADPVMETVLTPTNALGSDGFAETGAETAAVLNRSGSIDILNTASPYLINDADNIDLSFDGLISVPEIALNASEELAYVGSSTADGSFGEHRVLVVDLATGLNSTAELSGEISGRIANVLVCGANAFISDTGGNVVVTSVDAYGNLGAVVKSIETGPGTGQSTVNPADCIVYQATAGGIVAIDPNDPEF